MASKHILGQAVVIALTATTLNNPFLPDYVPYDPTTPTLTIVEPGGAVHTMTYPTSPAITKWDDPDVPGQSVGMFYATINPLTLATGTPTGLWKWRWTDPDPTRPGLAQGSFSVTAPQIPLS